MVNKIQSKSEINSEAEIAKKIALAQNQRAKEKDQGIAAGVASIANNLFVSMKSNPRTYLVGLLACLSGYVSYNRNIKVPNPLSALQKTTNPQAAASHTQVDWPTTPKSNPNKQWDYRGGHGAKSYQDFKDLISGEYEVSSNKIAENQKAFTYNPIIVYGEIHDTPRLPNLPTEKGFVFLEEGKDPYKCLPKYQINPSNKCIIIDNNELVDDLVFMMGKVTAAQRELADLILPGHYKKLEIEVMSTSNQMLDLIMQGDVFVKQNFMGAFNKADVRTKQKLNIAAASYENMSIQFDSLELSYRVERDKAMTSKPIEVLKQADEDSSAIVLVGASHAEPIAKGLMKAFPDRAVVMAIDHNAKKKMAESGV